MNLCFLKNKRGVELSRIKGGLLPIFILNAIIGLNSIGKNFFIFWSINPQDSKNCNIKKAMKLNVIMNILF